MGAHFEGAFHVSASIDQVRSLLQSQAFFDQLQLSPQNKIPTPMDVVFVVYHGVSFSSWGEKITITLTPIDRTATHVHIRSACVVPTQLVAWGKNKENVNNISSYIQTYAPQIHCAPPPPPPPPPAQKPNYGFGFCPHCGNPHKAFGAFCAVCGKKQP